VELEEVHRAYGQDIELLQAKLEQKDVEFGEYA
jgi:hypothetical protein